MRNKQEDGVQFLLNLLPKSLHREVTMGIFERSVKENYIFQSFDPESYMIKKLLQCLTPNHPMPESTIYDNRDVAKEMYLIIQGTVEIHQPYY